MQAHDAAVFRYEVEQAEESETIVVVEISHIREIVPSDGSLALARAFYHIFYFRFKNFTANTRRDRSSAWWEVKVGTLAMYRRFHDEI